MDESSHESLARYTTLKVGGEAQRLCQPTSVEEMVETVSDLQKRGEPWHILGGGSNILISSKGVEGTVIRTAQIVSMAQLDHSLLEAGAGARLPHLARYAAVRGLAGLEFAVGIPGTVGGGIIMNCGAHGSCMAEVIETVTIYDATTKSIQTLDRDDLDFQYRRSKLDPSKQVVLSARFRLAADEPDKIEQRIRANEEYRWRTQPLGWPNAGSTFKNPDPKRGAGLLLDQAGAKGLTIGNAAVSAVHANFVINLGGATSNQVSELLKKMQAAVHDAFQVRLHPEWKILGTFSPSEQEAWSLR